MLPPSWPCMKWDRILDVKELPSVEVGLKMQNARREEVCFG